jgi:SPP1 family predicted phage head-tail adaptor
MYRAGELDKLITIQRETKTADGMGGNVAVLTNVATNLWAHVRPMTGSERGIYDAVEASAMYLFVIRTRDDIVASDRIVWEGYDFNIRAIKGRGARPMYLEIEAQRGVPQ